jgi:hypothetical protein
VTIIVRELENHVFRFDINESSIGKEPWPHGGPVGMENFHLRYMGAELGCLNTQKRI